MPPIHVDKLIQMDLNVDQYLSTVTRHLTLQGLVPYEQLDFTFTEKKTLPDVSNPPLKPRPKDLADMETVTFTAWWDPIVGQAALDKVFHDLMEQHKGRVREGKD